MGKGIEGILDFITFFNISIYFLVYGDTPTGTLYMDPLFNDPVSRTHMD